MLAMCWGHASFVCPVQAVAVPKSSGGAPDADAEADADPTVDASGDADGLEQDEVRCSTVIGRGNLIDLNAPHRPGWTGVVGFWLSSGCRSSSKRCSQPEH